MSNKKLPQDFVYLPDMYSDDYYPDMLVDKVKNAIAAVVQYIEEGNHSTEEIQERFDRMTIQINELEQEFADHDSEIETVAREAIGETVERIIQYFDIAITTEDAIREREW